MKERKERLIIDPVEGILPPSGKPGGLPELVSALKWGSRF